jgi:hypothetical protein
VKSRAERFREYAVDCAKLAAASKDDQGRAVLMLMAGAWLRLAESEEKRREPTIGDLVGSSPAP